MKQKSLRKFLFFNFLIMAVFNFAHPVTPRLINELGLQDKRLDNFEMTFTTYMPTKRRIDCDNTVPKFILDGFTESGFIIDDDGSHLKSLTLKTG